MIQINELRINNIVFCQHARVGVDKDRAERLEIKAVFEKGKIWGMDYDCCLVEEYDISEIEGIELSKEILKRCNPSEVVFRLEESGAGGYHIDIIGEAWLTNNIIYYLHEYQNIHYSLEGCELEVVW